MKDDIENQDPRDEPIVYKPTLRSMSLDSAYWQRMANRTQTYVEGKLSPFIPPVRGSSLSPPSSPLLDSNSSTFSNSPATTLYSSANSSVSTFAGLGSVDGEEFPKDQLNTLSTSSTPIPFQRDPAPTPLSNNTFRRSYSTGGLNDAADTSDPLPKSKNKKKWISNISAFLRITAISKSESKTNDQPFSEIQHESSLATAETQSQSPQRASSTLDENTQTKNPRPMLRKAFSTGDLFKKLTPNVYRPAPLINRVSSWPLSAKKGGASALTSSSLTSLHSLNQSGSSSDSEEQSLPSSKKKSPQLFKNFSKALTGFLSKSATPSPASSNATKKFDPTKKVYGSADEMVNDALVNLEERISNFQEKMPDILKYLETGNEAELTKLSTDEGVLRPLATAVKHIRDLPKNIKIQTEMSQKFGAPFLPISDPAMMGVLEKLSAQTEAIYAEKAPALASTEPDKTAMLRSWSTSAELSALSRWDREKVEKEAFFAVATADFTAAYSPLQDLKAATIKAKNDLALGPLTDDQKRWLDVGVSKDRIGLFTPQIESVNPAIDNALANEKHILKDVQLYKEATTPEQKEVALAALVRHGSGKSFGGVISGGLRSLTTVPTSIKFLASKACFPDQSKVPQSLKDAVEAVKKFDSVNRHGDNETIKKDLRSGKLDINTFEQGLIAAFTELKSPAFRETINAALSPPRKLDLEMQQSQSAAVVAPSISNPNATNQENETSALHEEAHIRNPTAREMALIKNKMKPESADAPIPPPEDLARRKAEVLRLINNEIENSTKNGIISIGELRNVAAIDTHFTVVSYKDGIMEVVPQNAHSPSWITKNFGEKVPYKIDISGEKNKHLQGTAERGGPIKIDQNEKLALGDLKDLKGAIEGRIFDVNVQKQHIVVSNKDHAKVNPENKYKIPADKTTCEKFRDLFAQGKKEITITPQGNRQFQCDSGHRSKEQGKELGQAAVIGAAPKKTR
ncbi:MAG: hypothetical protein V4568_15170 [Pseudomonadota bacterium]